MLGDLGSHWLDLALWLMGEVTEIGCVSARFVERADRPDGSDYERSEDSTVMTVRFESGAYGTLQVCAVSWNIWGGARRGRVHDTYRDVFRVNRAMIGDWIDAIQDGRAVAPALAQGARVQQLLELAQRSAAGDGRFFDARV